MKMLPDRFLFKTALIVLIPGVMCLASCEQKTQQREYEEIVTTVTETLAEKKPKDFRAFMGQMPKDHPDIASLTKQLPADHPDLSALMEQLPPDHPDISSSMMLPAGSQSPQLQKALEASVARPPLSWTTPEGWTEENGGSMRLATFRAGSQTGAIECSIVSLGGQAGGLDSNVARWINQLAITLPAEKEFTAFLSRQAVLTTDGGFSMTVIDLTELSSGQDPTTPSMIGAIAELPDQTIFVKMTGSYQAVVNQRTALKALCQSLRLE